MGGRLLLKTEGRGPRRSGKVSAEGGVAGLNPLFKAEIPTKICQLPLLELFTRFELSSLDSDLCLCFSDRCHIPFFL